MIETLKAYQAWRCGDDERTLEDTGLTPAIIGEAIDWAIGVAEERDTLADALELSESRVGYFKDRVLELNRDIVRLLEDRNCLESVIKKLSEDGEEIV